MRNILSIMALSVALMATPALAAGDGARQGGPDGKGRAHKMERMKEHMKKLDTDGDGAISKAEFMAGQEAHFARMDKNGDGKLDKADRPKRGERGPGGPGGPDGAPADRAGGPEPAPAPAAAEPEQDE